MEDLIVDLTLVKPISPATELKQALHDLDILRILCFADHRFTPQTAASWMERYFCSDADEIEARSAVLTDIQNHCTSDDFQQAIACIAAIRAEQDKLSRALYKLDEVLYRWRTMQAYVRCIDTFSRLFPEDTYLSDRIRAFSAFFRTLQAAPETEQCRTILQEMEELLPLPKYLYLGVNVKEDGSPQELGVLSEGTDILPTNALLCPTDHTLPSDTLGPEFYYNSSLYGFHFDEYLRRALEKEWKSDLAHAKKRLAEGKLSQIECILNFEEQLDFYLVGLYCTECYRNRGYSLCRPTFRTGGGFFASNIKYPELILHQDGIQGNDITLRPSDAIIITGANHSGKTSYLKTLGQGFLLAQLGFFVPADSLSLTPVTGIYTLFSAGEDNSMDASRMGVEIQKLTNILQHATSTDLVLLNEPMTSTNPVEAISICADLMQHFLSDGIMHLLVTHLYDIYFLLRARLSDTERQHLKSLITESYFDEQTHGMVHHYRLREAEPEGNSYARETAASFGITLHDMIADPTSLEQAGAFCRSHKDNLVYEREDSHGISDLSDHQ
jgi:hypothetical protein